MSRGNASITALFIEHIQCIRKKKHSDLSSVIIMPMRVKGGSGITSREGHRPADRPGLGPAVSRKMTTGRSWLPFWLEAHF